MATTKDSVKTAQTKAVENAGKSAGPGNTQAQVGNQQPKGTSQTDENTVKLDDMTAEQQVAHFDSIAKERNLTDDERDQLNKAKNAAEEKRKNLMPVNSTARSATPIGPIVKNPNSISSKAILLNF